MNGYHGDRIGKLRRAMRLSRQALGNALEINQRTIARWESGEIDVGRWALLAVQHLQNMNLEERRTICAPVVAARPAVPARVAAPADPLEWTDIDGSVYSRDPQALNYYEPIEDEPDDGGPV